MPGHRERLLWTGPVGSSIWPRTLEQVPVRGPSLCLVPTEAARTQVLHTLALRGATGPKTRVWMWDDLWGEIARRAKGPPMRLSEAGVRTALVEAIARARRQGEVRVLGDLAETPGFRRRLRGRIANWTQQSLIPRTGPPRGPSAVDQAEWAIFDQYRRVLQEAKADDPEGFADRAASALKRGKLPGWDWGQFPHVAILEPPPVSDHPAWRAMEVLHRHTDALHVAVLSDQNRHEAFFSFEAVWKRLDTWGFNVEHIAADPDRPAGLRVLDNGLFRDDPTPVEPFDDAAGLRFLGAPQGEGIGLVVARRALELLRNEPGTRFEDITVVVPRRDEQEMIAGALRSWGIPVTAGRSVRLAGDPAVTTLCLALRLPLDDWNAGKVARFLRNGQVRPSWREAASPLDLAATSAAIRDAQVYRDARAIRSALDRAAVLPEPEATEAQRRRAERATRAVAIFDRLVRLLDPFNTSASWWVQVDRLNAVRTELGIGDHDTAGRHAIEHLVDALHEHGDVLEGLGQDNHYVSWGEFVREVQSIARDLNAPSAPSRPGSVLVTTPEAVVGARARHLLLVNLIEGTFPDREAIRPDPALVEIEDATPVATARAAFSKEMFRFLRLIGTAERSLTFIYPTTDEKGQSLLVAGFLEEIRELFSEVALQSATHEFRRLDPVLDEELAGSPREQRVRAVALGLPRKSG